MPELKAFLQHTHGDTVLQPSTERLGCGAEPGDAQPAPVPTPRGLQAPRKQQRHVRHLEIQHLQGSAIGTKEESSLLPERKAFRAALCVQLCRAAPCSLPAMGLMGSGRFTVLVNRP